MKKIITIFTALFIALTLVVIPSTTNINAADSVKMFRVYNPNSGEHFYTADVEERNDLVWAGWTAEGIGWYAPSKSNTPVYRLYSGTDHHYTMNKTERDNLIKVGWKDEGIGWYSDDSKSVPLYRQFNPYVDPNAKTNNSGSHNYTTSKSENDNLVKVGWRDEGIAWYATQAGYSYKYQPTVIGANTHEGTEMTAFTVMEYGNGDSANDAAFAFLKKESIKCKCSPGICGLYFNFNTGKYAYKADWGDEDERLTNEGVLVQIGYGVTGKLSS